MDMQINTELVKSYRNRKAWSQGQLAEVSGLSLRTIQRIEKTGSASLESVKSLAAVFEIEAKDLQEIAESPKNYMKTKLAAFVGVTFVALSSLFVITATAHPVMVNVQLKAKGAVIADLQMLNEEGKESEMQVSDTVKIVLYSAIESGSKVRIATKIYDITSGKEVLIASPTLLTTHQEQSEVHFGGYELQLTPNL